ncbi:MAG: universal stress protein [Proteobacteria bacterium]|nr:universal stress protein [Pseudomonadota bacterium]
MRTNTPWPPKRILCLSDLSIASHNALEWATKMAQPLNAELLVMNADQPKPTMARTIGIQDWTQLDQKMEAESRRIQGNLRHFVGQAHTHHPNTRTAIRFGQLKQDIANFVEDHKVDLVVVGHDGPSGASASLNVPTTLQVLRSIRCSLLSVPHL